MRRLVFIETSDIGARYSALAARDLGFDPLFVCNMKNYQADTLAQIREFDHIDLVTEDSGAIANALRDYDVFGVTTFLDSRLEIAIEVAQILGVNGLEPAILPLKDKGYVYNLLPEAMPHSLFIDRREPPLKAIEKFFASHPGGYVLKPRKTAGAIGARIFHERPTLDECLRHMRETSIPDFLDPNAWILQTFIEGRLASLEGFVANGEFTALGVTGRKKVGQTESVSTFPDDDSIHAEALSWMKDSCRDLLRAAKIFNAYFHIEFITGVSGTKIIDANIGRLGGGGIGELLALSFNQSPIQVFRHAILVSLRLPGESPYGARRSETAISVNYGVSEDGYFEELKNLGPLYPFHTQILDEKQKIVAMGGNNWAWIGIATGMSDNLLERLDQVQIQMQHEVLSPCY